MKNILLFIITAIAHAIASLLGLRSWAKAKKADVNLYLTEEDYSFIRMFPKGAALARHHEGSNKSVVNNRIQKMFPDTHRTSADYIWPVPPSEAWVNKAPDVAYKKAKKAIEDIQRRRLATMAQSRLQRKPLYEYAEHGLEDTKNPKDGAPWCDLD